MMECIKPGISEYSELKSRFIAHCFFSEGLESFQENLLNFKKVYHEASHFIYAVRCVSEDHVFEKCSDDGEPKGVGGIPVLRVLQKKNIINTSVVVIRYFGGTKLGKKRLLSAYLKAAVAAIEESFFKQRKKGQCIELMVTYSDFPIIEKRLMEEGAMILQKNYTDRIKLTIWMEDLTFKQFQLSFLAEKMEIVDIKKMDML